MISYIPKKVYYEKEVLKYEQGLEIYNRYKNMGIPTIEISSHNKIEELRQLPDKEFTNLKKYLILGIRKSLRLIPNDKSADFIVPFTSSGCMAMCTYCYLVCTFFKGAYLRVFVNREQMMQAIKRKINKIGEHKVYELGSNSDMVLENVITGNLRWAVEEFGKLDNATATFATKFNMVDDLLDAKHNGNTQIRISVNPHEIIKKVEIGTSSLDERIKAANKMYRAGYKVGINIAPIILIKDWRRNYKKLIKELHDKLNKEMHDKIFFELIFMTYGYANDIINKEAMPNVYNVFDKNIMRPKGRGKYCYKQDIRNEAESYIFDEISKYFPYAKISYCV